jgi:hypothetical protein
MIYTVYTGVACIPSLADPGKQGFAKADAAAGMPASDYGQANYGCMESRT